MIFLPVKRNKKKKKNRKKGKKKGEREKRDFRLCFLHLPQKAQYIRSLNARNPIYTLSRTLNIKRPKKKKKNQNPVVYVAHLERELTTLSCLIDLQ